MAGVVADEPELREHNPQESGRQHCEPRVADADESYPTRNVSEKCDADPQALVDGPALQQASRRDLVEKVAEGELRCVYVGLHGTPKEVVRWTPPGSGVTPSRGSYGDHST